MRSYFIAVLFFCAFLTDAIGQDPVNYQNRFRTGKELFVEGRYDLAMETLRIVTQPAEGNIYRAYAQFYYGLAAIQDGQLGEASRTFGKLKDSYPDWQDQQEVAFWQGYLSFRQGNLEEGYRQLMSMKNGLHKTALETVKSYFVLQEFSVARLQRLFEAYSTDEELAIHLANCITAQPMVQQNQELLDFIITDFELDPAAYNRITPEQSVKKEIYRIAVMLPFMYKRVGRLAPNSIPNFFKGLLDMYEGMRMAVEELDSMGMPVELLAYDTQRDTATVAKILAKPEMQSVDLIIGPLYPGPLNLVRDFSEANHIMMVNPLSSNAEVIGSNPFAFLMSPSNETRARRVAEYMATHADDSVAFVFYGPRAQDSVYAFAYQAELLQRGFEVPLIKKITTERSQEAFEYIAKTVDIDDLQRLDSARAVEEIREFNKRARRNPEANQRLEKEKFFEIANDSIGHVLVASNNGLIAASVVGAIETRAAKGDSVVLIGAEEWLLQGYDYITFNQLERLGVLLTAPTFFDKSTPHAEAFQEAYIKRQMQLPAREVYTGYDMLLFLGKQLHEHGTYFQFGMRNQGMVSGNFLQGFDFRGANDNQHVPLIRFRNFTFEAIDVHAMDNETNE